MSSTAELRNLALVGHTGAGKTTLVEALLARAGAVRAAGNVARGTTVCDHEPQARALLHSVAVNACHLVHDGVRVNLLDTPGLPDLAGRALTALPAVETVLVVVDAVAGIQPGTRRLYEAARTRGLCRFVVVNRIDAPDADPEARLADVAQAFGPECLPVNLPGADGAAVHDCFFARRGPPTACGSIESAHRALIERVVEEDDALLTRYLETDEDPDPAALHAPFERALRLGHLAPVCFVSAERGLGLGELLDALAKLAPDPTEGNPPPYLKGEGAEARAVEVSADPARHALAHVFKVSIDPYVGRIALLRVHQGTLRAGQALYVGDARKPVKLAHIYRVQGKELAEVPQAGPGEICALTKVEEAHFDAVLHDSHDEDHHHLRSVDFPPPLYGVAIEPARHGDETRLADALHRLAAEDPSLRVAHDADAHETVLYGVGETHLKLLLDKLREQHGLVLTTHPPSIAYRETVTAAADGHHRHKKQTGGAGQFGEVYLRVAPLPRGAGFEFTDEVKGGAIPRQFIPAVEKGVRQALGAGALAGFPLIDVKVTVYDGKHHSVDSKEVAFIAAGRKALLDAVGRAQPIVLEPIVNLRVVAPSDAVGGVTGDLAARRGRILRQGAAGGAQLAIEAQAPLAELDGFATRLRALTAGRGSHALEFSHYEAVPPRVQQELAGRARRRAADD